MRVSCTHQGQAWTAQTRSHAGAYQMQMDEHLPLQMG